MNIILEKILFYGLNRLKEPSTIRGIVAVLGGSFLAAHPEYTNAITAVVLAVIGLLGIVLPDLFGKKTEVKQKVEKSNGDKVETEITVTEDCEGCTESGSFSDNFSDKSPDSTQERKKEAVKVSKSFRNNEGEPISVRNPVIKDIDMHIKKAAINEKIKEQKKNEKVSENDMRKANEEIEKDDKDIWFNDK